MTGSHEAEAEVHLEAILQIRYGGGQANHFWLSHGDARHPAMSIFAKADLASLHFFPTARHPGFRSAGGEALGLEPGGFTIFYMNNVAEEEEVLNDSVVPFSVALVAAKEFLRTAVKPTSLQWFRL